jgi:hypothetical protein
MSRWSDLVNTINITLFSSCGEVVPLHTMKATRGSGGITWWLLYFRYHLTRRLAGVQLRSLTSARGGEISVTTPADLPSEMRSSPVTIEEQTGWATEPVWILWWRDESLASRRGSRVAHSLPRLVLRHCTVQVTVQVMVSYSVRLGLQSLLGPMTRTFLKSWTLLSVIRRATVWRECGSQVTIFVRITYTYVHVIFRLLYMIFIAQDYLQGTLNDQSINSIHSFSKIHASCSVSSRKASYSSCCSSDARVYKFSQKNLGATWKFVAPEERHEASSIQRALRY